MIFASCRQRLSAGGFFCFAPMLHSVAALQGTIGSAATGLSLLGFAALWLWSWLYPSAHSVPTPPDGTVTTVRYGLFEFLRINDCMWLLWLCIAGSAAGIALMATHRVRRDQPG